MRLPDSLDLHVEGRLAKEDAQRQQQSAQAILDRFGVQPGVILGDEVGMGKTFVALAVAAAHVVKTPSRPVVVMVPRKVVEKWRRDSAIFREKCLRSSKDRAKFRVAVAETGIDFLKLLDDPEERHPATVILLEHGALNRRLADHWTKLAVLQAAIKGRHGVASLRERLARYAPDLLRISNRPSEEFLQGLLKTPPSDWKRLLVAEGVLHERADDPVPRLFLDTLESFDLAEVFRLVVELIPGRASKNLQSRLATARAALNGEMLPIWNRVLREMNLSLPLLILDEAHHVRHGGTRLAQQFATTREDLDVAGGPLAQRFDRMLFLTATPFQLGHSELCNVLSRFDAVLWKGRRAPSIGRDAFKTAMEDLRKRLDEMQLATERLERGWKRLLAPDFDEAADHGEAWWDYAILGGDPECAAVSNERVRAVMLAYRLAHSAIRESEIDLRPWVLRSSRSPFLPSPHDLIPRRERLEGAAVLTELAASNTSLKGGLRVLSGNALPFLLAARMGALGMGRGVFAEGIASSYEALLDTQREKNADVPAEPEIGKAGIANGQWHLARLRESVQAIGPEGRSLHPKVQATISLAMSLWRQGEKVLIFCHYRQTGRALHQYLSEAMLAEIRERAAERIGCSQDEVEQRLKPYIDRFDRDRATDVLDEIETMLSMHPDLQEPHRLKGIQDVVLRFLRTPTFLVRFADLSEGSPPNRVEDLFERQDASGLSLREVLRQFFDFLANRCGGEERDAYLEALSKVQTGTHAGAEVEQSFGDDETQNSERTRLVANVRRVYGDTGPETRDRIMLTFNTPFYPEILIASSVMAEGVDLHLSCRHVIHHDLDWNPSSLEQRTGRVDRLGSKAERSGRPIRVYMPYVEGCQDEKLFRVVMDRERWFGVVMGADESMTRILSATTWEAALIDDQPLVPSEMVEGLKLRLDNDRRVAEEELLGDASAHEAA